MRLFRSRRAAARLGLAPGASTRPGTYAVNEDAMGEATSMGHALLVVADGLGGHRGGENASRVAVDRAIELFRQRPSLDPAAVEQLVHGAHRAVRSLQAADEDDGPRTTLTVLVSDGASGRWAHVGDSRLYFFRDRRVHARTRDHSVPEMLHRTGEIQEEAIRHHPDRSRLLQALGQEADPKIAVSDAMPLRAGDVFLLCSDGWWENVDDEQMEASLAAARDPGDWLTKMSEAIAAAGRNPQDNYTAVAAFVG